MRIPKTYVGGEGKKKIRSFRKEMATKNKSIKECREFGGRKQNLLKDIST